MDDIGLDSLDLVEFVMVLEDHFEIEVCFLLIPLLQLLTIDVDRGDYYIDGIEYVNDLRFNFSIHFETKIFSGIFEK